jgi:D-mannonate dehydratase
LNGGFARHGADPPIVSFGVRVTRLMSSCLDAGYPVCAECSENGVPVCTGNDGASWASVPPPERALHAITRDRPR